MSNLSDNRSRTAVVGIGNYLRGDDGAGIHAVNRLRKITELHHIDIIDGARAGPGLRFCLEGRSRVIFIDAGEFGGSPGEWTRFTPEEAVSHKGISSFSLHGFDLLSFLQSAEQETGIPQAVIYALQPESCEAGTELSGPVSAGLDDMIPVLIGELRKHC